MSSEVLISLLTFGGTLLLVVTGLLNFSVFVRQLRCLKNETKEETETDLRMLISASGNDEAERTRRERLLRHLQSTDKAEPLELAKYSLERAHNLA